MLTLVIMTNISKHKIKSDDYQLVYKKLTDHIGKLSSRSAPDFVNALLTESERIMLVKRFGAIFMFTQNYSQYRVAQTLGLSQPTAHRLFEQYQNGVFKKLFAELHKKDRLQFLSLLEDLILAQASPQARTRLTNHALKY